jgi:hypothetical protein
VPNPHKYEQNTFFNKFRSKVIAGDIDVILSYVVASAIPKWHDQTPDVNAKLAPVVNLRI